MSDEFGTPNGMPNSDVDVGVRSPNPDVDDGRPARIRLIAVREGSVSALARKAGIPQTTLAGHASGKSEPRASDLAKLAIAGGVSVDWLVSGQPESTPVQRASGATDGRLMGRLTEGIMRVFKEVGQAAAVRQVVERAAEYHDRIVARTTDAEERIMLAGECLAELRQELRAATAAPTETKHSA